MKICVITPRFSLSGVPLAQIRFARALAASGHDVSLVIGHINQGYKLPELDGINVIILNKSRVIHILIPMIRYLKKENPDVIFSAEDHLNGIVLLAALISGSKAKISGSSRVTPFDTYSNIPFSKRWVLKQIMRVLMPRADVLTCVSQDMIKQYRQVFSTAPHICIYNIVDDKTSRLKMKEPVDHDWLADKKETVVVAAGRLAYWKGFEDLIHAMKELNKKRKARLIILGDGPLRGELESLILKLGLSNVVSLEGYVENPLKYFVHADVFALSSHVEGLPNVLVEAMMCGCTPVSTDCPTGPREVLQGGKYGFLVPVKDPIAMAAGIEKALESPIPTHLLREAIKPFSEHEVIKRHFEILGLTIPDQSTREAS